MTRQKNTLHRNINYCELHKKYNKKAVAVHSYLCKFSNLVKKKPGCFAFEGN